MKKWLFNPFIYVAGMPALLIGWAIMLATAIIGFYSHAHFDGVIDMHVGGKAPFSVYCCEQLVDWGLVAILLYAAGLVFSKSRIRFIDIAGTLALARWPMVICAIAGFGITAPSPAIHTVDDAMKSMNSLLAIAFYGLLVIMPFVVWSVALMFNAFKISCNIKGGKAAAIFAVTMLIAEIAAHITLHQLYKHFI